MKPRNGRRRLDENRIRILGGDGHHDFDEQVVELVNLVGHGALRFEHCEYTTWADGESGMRIVVPARIHGKHVVIFACPINNELELDLRDMLYACKQQYGASHITVVLSFLRYRRQDRKEKKHEIQRLQCFLRDLKHWGADTLVVCDPHAEQTTIRYARKAGLRIKLADPTNLFADALRPMVQTYGSKDRVMIYSPDFGSVGRALKLGYALGLRVLATPKQRLTTGETVLVKDRDFIRLVRNTYGNGVPISCNLQDAEGMHLVMREDEIDSGGTAGKTANQLREAGAESVHLVVTHAVCSRTWKDRLLPWGQDPPFDSAWFGDTRPRGERGGYRESTGNRVKHVEIAPIVAQQLLTVLPYVKN